MIQLNPSYPVETPLGPGDAIIYQDDGVEIFWTVILRDTRAIVQFKNNRLRAAKTYTANRGISDEDMRNRIGL